MPSSTGEQTTLVRHSVPVFSLPITVCPLTVKGRCPSADSLASACAASDQFSLYGQINK